MDTDSYVSLRFKEMKDDKQDYGSRVITPEGGASYWQPVPANGFVRTLFNAKQLGAHTAFSAGTQTIDPGSFVREHMHDAHEELIYIVEGEGTVVLDGVEHALAPGASLFLARNSTHKFLNPGPGPLSFFWVLMPGGLDDFFRQIGRPRSAGEPAPAPFPRPENIAEIEANTVFGWTKK